MKKLLFITLLVAVLFLGLSNQSMAFLVTGQTMFIENVPNPEPMILLSFGIGLFVLGGITRRRFNNME